ncbi:MAG TPA: exosortase system-associated protein, TIGR04073 family [Candidatus Omnitrophota bacterium]|nr:exosortase system-associated protein, TIGR04073 family [Candidatus Omnitrophota bacterium]
MKKIFLAVAAVLTVLAFSFQAGAEGLKTGFSLEGSKEKLLRGAANLADSVVEIPGTMMRKSKADGALSGMTLGMVEGALNTVKRALAGVWEVATFPVPLPENYEAILSDPEFLNVD